MARIAVSSAGAAREAMRARGERRGPRNLIEPDAAAQIGDILLAEAGVGASGAGLRAIEAGG